MKPVIISFFLVILAYSTLSNQGDAKAPAQSNTISFNRKMPINIADSSQLRPYSMLTVSEQQYPMFVPWANR
ncbi:MAG: hypothetical protein LBD21_04530 [Tannerellaceae bacterium]|jgi:hypothetical protein|nr:hypothetical protein [Tannerellaceae bacterium]